MVLYVDFNGIEDCEDGSDDSTLDLTGYGTLASLSLLKLKLSEGLTLDLGDPDGLRVKGIVYFDENRISDRCSGWFAKFQRSNISDNKPLNHDFSSHLCFKCRKDMKSHLDAVGRQFKEVCPFCGTPVMFPLSPPN